MSSAPSDYAIIAEVPAGKGEVIRITRSTYRGGTPITSIRVWFKAQNGEYRPGKAGISFATDLVLEATIAALQTALPKGAEQ